MQREDTNLFLLTEGPLDALHCMEVYNYSFHFFRAAEQVLFFDVLLSEMSDHRREKIGKRKHKFQL